jgi:O-acetyl-ADP-ribose deacetylase (regulator of RNase III)
MLIEVRQADLLTFEGDAIILPTISSGVMDQGFAARFLELVGHEIEKQVVGHAPIAVGAALLTEAPNTTVRYLIHVPVVEETGMRVSVENIRRAARAGLLGASRYELERVAMPGVGYGEGGVPHEEAARAIVDEVIAFKAPFPTGVTLMDEDEEMLDAFEQHVPGS